MTRRTLALVLITLFLGTTAWTVSAAGLGNADDDMPRRLVEIGMAQAVPKDDPRVGKARAQLQQVMKVTGEAEASVASACLRTSRHIFDVAKVRATPLEVLDFLTQHASTDKPLNEITQRYFELRTRHGLDHAGAMK